MIIILKITLIERFLDSLDFVIPIFIDSDFFFYFVLNNNEKNGCVGTQRNVLRYDVNITWRVLEVVLIKVYSQQHRVMQYSVCFYNLGLLTGLKSVENVYCSSVNCHANDFF